MIARQEKNKWQYQNRLFAANVLLLTITLIFNVLIVVEGKEYNHHLRHRRDRGLHGMHTSSRSNDDGDDEQEATTTNEEENDIIPKETSSYMDIIVNKEQHTHPIPPPPHKKKKHKHNDNNNNKDNTIDEKESTNTPELQLPEYLSTHLTNLTVPFQHLTDVPLFLHIPKSGGTLIKHHYGKCLQLVESTQRGKALSSHETLEIVTDPKTNIKYVNVDTTHVEGIEEAATKSVVSSHLADIVFTSYLYESLTELFDVLHPGKLFLLLRHPIEREVSLFYFKQKAQSESKHSNNNPEWKNLTIEEYAKKGVEISNPLVRMLTKPNGFDTVPTKDDLNLAKIILQQKALIGLTSRMEESILNFDRYFGWYDESNDQVNACRKHLVQHGLNVNHHTMIEERSVAWNMLYKRHSLDMELYEYALGLYEEQKEKLQMGTLNVER